MADTSNIHEAKTHLSCLLERIGDCLTYAVARLAGEPMLFTVQDFLRTDIGAALE